MMQKSQRRDRREEKVRNYSFRNSKKLPPSKMTEVNGIKVPSIPGSCYHAIICALATHKNKFCNWAKIVELVEKYMRQYGGHRAWEKFRDKTLVKDYKQRIKDNCHTLTRTGKDCYGYRLHEQGMCIYFFKDGAILFTGGQMQDCGDQYDVIFLDKRLQYRYRGTTMTYQEYRKFLESGYINPEGRILDQESIRDYREGLHESIEIEEEKIIASSELTPVCVTLVEEYTQSTADRIEQLGLIVEQVLDNDLIGALPQDQIENLRNDSDVIDVVEMAISGVN
jgi:hypothetical protein